MKLEQVDSTRDVKLRNLRTNDLLDTKDMDRTFGEVQGILNDDTLLVIKAQDGTDGDFLYDEIRCKLRWNVANK